MVVTQKTLDVNALIDSIHDATNTLIVNRARTMEVPGLQYLEDHDRQKLLVATQDLISQLEVPEVKALKIAKGVRWL